MTILKHLAATPQSGYGLIKIIEETSGWKPSYGSIYPQLEQLTNEGLVTFKEEGRKKIYSLTKKGDDALTRFSEDHSVMIAQMRENMNTLAHMMDADMDAHQEMMDLFISALERGDNTFKEFEKPSLQLKMAFFKLYKEGKLKKNKKTVSAIMEEAAKKMERLL